jgi:hypothetical protein
MPDRLRLVKWNRRREGDPLIRQQIVADLFRLPRDPQRDARFAPPRN